MATICPHQSGKARLLLISTGHNTRLLRKWPSLVHSLCRRLRSIPDGVGKCLPAGSALRVAHKVVDKCSAGPSPERLSFCYAACCRAQRHAESAALLAGISNHLCLVAGRMTVYSTITTPLSAGCIQDTAVHAYVASGA